MAVSRWRSLGSIASLRQLFEHVGDTALVGHFTLASGPTFALLVAIAIGGFGLVVE